MKTVTITCDVCEKELIGEHIEIGAQSDGYLQYKNTLRHRGVGQLISIDNHETLSRQGGREALYVIFLLKMEENENVVFTNV